MVSFSEGKPPALPGRQLVFDIYGSRPRARVFTFFSPKSQKDAYDQNAPSLRDSGCIVAPTPPHAEARG